MANRKNGLTAIQIVGPFGSISGFQPRTERSCITWSPEARRAPGQPRPRTTKTRTLTWSPDSHSSPPGPRSATPESNQDAWLNLDAARTWTAPDRGWILSRDRPNSHRLPGSRFPSGQSIWAALCHPDFSSHRSTPYEAGPEDRATLGKSRRRTAYPQQIVTTRLLYCLQDRFAQLSRLQRI